MKNAQELESALAHFTGTNQYHRLSTRVVLTDGAKFLAEQAECFWLFDIVSSMALIMFQKDEHFLVVKIKRVNPFPDSEDKRYIVTFEDGNGHELFKQKIDYSDFPFVNYEFFAKTSGHQDPWFYTCMLKSEY